MWGINPFTVGKIIAGVGVSSALLGRYGSLKQLTRKIKLHVSEKHAEAAMAMARSVALQDQSLYEKLKKSSNKSYRRTNTSASSMTLAIHHLAEPWSRQCFFMMRICDRLSR